MKELKKVLELHEKWLNGEQGGIRADLSNTDLRDVDLRGTNLNNADLRGTNLSNTDLRDADLRGTNLNNADLRYANLIGSNLSCADLNNADLRYVNLRYADLNCTNLSCADLNNANLRGTDLKGANLSYTDLNCSDLNCADLRDADLRYANLNNADLRDIKYNSLSVGLNPVCPEEGSYIGYKKAKTKKEDKEEKVIVKLLITEDALRSSATTRKCRCSKAKVLSITSLDGIILYSEAYSNWDNTFIYRVGEIVEVKDFDTNRWDECSTGIHHFITRKEAVEY